MGHLRLSVDLKKPDRRINVSRHMLNFYRVEVLMIDKAKPDERHCVADGVYTEEEMFALMDLVHTLRKMEYPDAG